MHQSTKAFFEHTVHTYIQNDLSILMWVAREAQADRKSTRACASLATSGSKRSAGRPQKKEKYSGAELEQQNTKTRAIIRADEICMNIGSRDGGEGPSTL